MTSTVTVTDLLANAGIADVTGLWPVEVVEDWNRRLEPIFAGTDGQRRSYASADALAETGIFAELFSEPVRQLIAGIHPSALLYHCHAYEIAANQGRPHIHRDKPLGWHRDTETIRAYTPDFPSFISIFILLSPVGPDDGAFEFYPHRPNNGMRAGGDAVQLIGPVGTAAMWNRSYFHRASPNRGSLRRRVLKVSFQPAGLPNDRIGLPEFTDARAHLTDPALLALIDERRVGTTTPLTDRGDVPAGTPLPPTTKNELSRTQAAYIRAQTVGFRALAAAGVV